MRILPGAASAWAGPESTNAFPPLETARQGRMTLVCRLAKRAGELLNGVASGYQAPMSSRSILIGFDMRAANLPLLFLPSAKRIVILPLIDLTFQIGRAHV